jgi:hypothetical protein
VKSPINPKTSVVYNPEYKPGVNAPGPRTIHKLTEYTGSVSAIFSPITFMYYAFSVKAQRKLIYLEKLEKKKIADLKYNNDFIALILGTDDIQIIEDTKRHCTFDEDFVINATFYELGIAIRDCHNDFLVKNHIREDSNIEYNEKY